MVALLMDGPMADHEIEVDEPRPIIEPERACAGRRIAHRYRLADVELVPVRGVRGRFVRRALYVYAGNVVRPASARAA
jgi:hypothetical protein